MTTRDTPEITFLNPPGLANLGTFSQVAVASGGRTIHISGQIAWDEQARLVGGGDLRVQTEQVFRNLGKALAAAGAGFADVIKFTVYVVDLQPADRVAISEVRHRFIDPARPPASTMIGVSALVVPDARIEIEAIAVVR
ncbi:MAG: RidA family protein [Betaproteobacteria bacterium]|nr:RidA family protein [Betaproteobacteria bacterium]